MADNKQQSQGCSISTCATIGIVFLILKLTKVITWSWIWVLAPFWIPAIITILVLIVMLIIFLKE